MTERRIIIASITSSDFLAQTRNIRSLSLITSPAMKRICSWAWDYYEKYGKAIGSEIETVFYEKAQYLPKKDAQYLEEILDSLTEEPEIENLEYLVDLAQTYFTECRLRQFTDRLTNFLDKGDIDYAEKFASEFTPFLSETEACLNFDSEMVLDRVDKAMNETNIQVVTFADALGAFWNSQFVRGGLIGLLASEKRGKTWMLMEIALRAARQRKKVVFFQAGDMTENQQLKRICVYLTEKSDQKKYCGKMFQPVRDCIYNQCNDCMRNERQGISGIFDKTRIVTLRKDVTQEELQELFEDFYDHVPCSHCQEYDRRPWGTVWLEEVDVGENPLTAGQAKQAIDEFFIQHKRHFKLSSHANGTLSVSKIRNLLSVWNKQDGFIPDLIVIDYADLLIGQTKEFRHLQNEIWKDLRRLSQENGQPLVVTATQADAKSYDSGKLKLSNFSEDKRKFSHVTAFYSLNQSPDDREKKLGILRIGELLLREGDFSITNEVTVLQNLRRGRPVISSYF